MMRRAPNRPANVTSVATRVLLCVRTVLRQARLGGAPAERWQLGPCPFECVLPPGRGLAVGSILTAAGLGVVCTERGGASETADVPPGSGVVGVADKATHITTFRVAEVNEACQAADEPPFPGR